MEAIGGEQVRLGSSHVVGRFFALSLNYRLSGHWAVEWREQAFAQLTPKKAGVVTTT
jgi:hypothetical protein